jgi:hypothetical protein
VNRFAVNAALVLTISAALSSCVTTNADGVKQYSFQKTAVSGDRLKISRVAIVKRDCNMRTLAEMRVIDPPQHGRVDIVHEKVEGKFSGDYRLCTGKEVMGTVAYYTSQKGYIGRDKVVIRASSDDGIVRDYVSEINVVK